MYQLTEVQTYLNELLTSQRVEECYNLISNPRLRVNTEDEQWVASQQEHEVNTVVEAIMEILNLAGLAQQSVVKSKVEEVIEIFEHCNITHKPRIPFYVLVIDKLI